MWHRITKCGHNKMEYYVLGKRVVWHHISILHTTYPKQIIWFAFCNVLFEFATCRLHPYSSASFHFTVNLTIASTERSHAEYGQTIKSWWYNNDKIRHTNPYAYFIGYFPLLSCYQVHLIAYIYIYIYIYWSFVLRGVSIKCAVFLTFS